MSVKTEPAHIIRGECQDSRINNVRALKCLFCTQPIDDGLLLKEHGIGMCIRCLDDHCTKIHIERLITNGVGVDHGVHN